MARKKAKEVAKVEEVEVKARHTDQPNVTVHLDRDPNDPRNVKPADKLPSLDD